MPGTDSYLGSGNAADIQWGPNSFTTTNDVLRYNIHSKLVNCDGSWASGYRLIRYFAKTTVHVCVASSCVHLRMRLLRLPRRRHAYSGPAHSWSCVPPRHIDGAVYSHRLTTRLYAPLPSPPPRTLPATPDTTVVGI